MSFSRSLRKLMEKNNLTVYRVAKDTGVKPQSIYKWMNGSIPKVDLAVKIADYFGTTVNEMMEDGD